MKIILWRLIKYLSVWVTYISYTIFTICINIVVNSIASNILIIVLWNSNYIRWFRLFVIYTKMYSFWMKITWIVLGEILNVLLSKGNFTLFIIIRSKSITRERTTLSLLPLVIFARPTLLLHLSCPMCGNKRIFRLDAWIPLSRHGRLFPFPHLARPNYVFPFHPTHPPHLLTLLSYFYSI